MRLFYVALKQHEHALFSDLRELVDSGLPVEEASASVGLSVQAARILLARGRMRPSDLRDRRKQYISMALGNKRTAHRHTPYVISRYFDCAESYVVQLIKDMRIEGLLPPVEEGDKEWQDGLLFVLRGHYPNVFRAATVGKEKEVGDKVYVAGKGWLSWSEVKTLVSKVSEK